MDITHIAVALPDRTPGYWRVMDEQMMLSEIVLREECTTSSPMETADANSSASLLTLLILLMTPEPTHMPATFISNCLQSLQATTSLDLMDACLEAGLIQSSSPVNCLSPGTFAAPGFYLLALQQQANSWTACIILLGENQALAYIANGEKTYKTFRYRGVDFLKTLRHSIQSLEGTDPILFVIEDMLIAEGIKSLFISAFTDQEDSHGSDDHQSELADEPIECSIGESEEELFRQISWFISSHPDMDPADPMALMTAHQHQQNPAENSVPESFQPLTGVNTVNDVFATTISNGVYIALFHFPEEAPQSTAAMLITTSGNSVTVLVICSSNCHEGGCHFECVVGNLVQWQAALTGIVPNCGAGCDVSLYEKKD